jgi:UDP-N-acetylmuramoyl-tripeptide--D-alanyl-D-alanine ligase
MKPGALAILNGERPPSAHARGKDARAVRLVRGRENCGCPALKMTDDGEHMSFCKVKTPTLDGQLTIPALGRHMIYPALMAVAAGEHFGLSPEELMGGVAAFSPTKMRMNVLQRGDGVTILDDAYNANPQSMRAAAEVLSGAKGSYKIAVLGDMFELGAFGPMLHTGVGEYLGRVGIDCLVAVGDLAKNIAAAAGAALVPEVHYVPTRAQAYPILEGLLRPGCTILVKASRGMAFEEIVAFLKEHTKEPKRGNRHDRTIRGGTREVLRPRKENTKRPDLSGGQRGTRRHPREERRGQDDAFPHSHRRHGLRRRRGSVARGRRVDLSPRFPSIPRSTRWRIVLRTALTACGD